MKPVTTALLIIAVISGGAGVIPAAMAQEQGMYGMPHMRGMGYGMHRDAYGWQASLSEQQRNQVAKLKLDYKKKVYPIKFKIRQAKVDLAMLIATDKPRQNDINKKIDDIAKLKAEKMRLKAAHKIEVRKVLNADQRARFDLKMLNKADHGKKGR